MFISHAVFLFQKQYLLFKVHCQSFAGMINQNSERSYNVLKFYCLPAAVSIFLKFLVCARRWGKVRLFFGNSAGRLTGPDSLLHGNILYGVISMCQQLTRLVDPDNVQVFRWRHVGIFGKNSSHMGFA